jgi:low molecular weight protein-tyrosine phosphatase
VALMLAVCTGNICRSPMAEGFLRGMLAVRGIEGVHVASCGVNGLEDSPAMPEGVQAMIENGVDISGHRARRMTAPMIREADLVLTMATEHRDTIAAQVDGAASRTFTLKEFARLLDLLPGRPAPTGDGLLLEEAVAAAAGLRASGALPPTRDEDVADPLGLGVEAYRATAWEIGQLCDRVVAGVFGAGLADSGGAARREGGV